MAKLKWPSRLVAVRHLPSAYNELVAFKRNNPDYLFFKQAYEQDPESRHTRCLARQVLPKLVLGVSDYATPLAPKAEYYGKLIGKALKSTERCAPDIVFVSPYLRTRQTWQALKLGWPELEGCEVVIEDRIREQEHGQALLYNDRRLFLALNPEQRRLYELEGPYAYQYPQGESVYNVRDRVRDFLGMLIREFAGLDVLIVTHHVVILALRANLERLSVEEFLELDAKNKPINGGVTTYVGIPEVGRRGEGHLKLKSYNVCLLDETKCISQ